MAILRKKHRNSTQAHFHLWRPRSWWRRREEAALAPPGLSLPAGQALRLPAWGLSCLLTMAVGLARAGRVVLESQGGPGISVCALWLCGPCWATYGSQTHIWPSRGDLEVAHRDQVDILTHTG